MAYLACYGEQDHYLLGARGAPHREPDRFSTASAEVERCPAQGAAWRVWAGALASTDRGRTGQNRLGGVSLVFRWFFVKGLAGGCYTAVPWRLGGVR